MVEGSAPPAEISFPMTATDTVLRELHHRVKNNFQIIASLMSLQKRMLPADRRGDLRFVEEHVHAMAVAYRVVYATGDMVEVSIQQLVSEVLDGLRQIAECRGDTIRLDLAGAGGTVSLDQAIALSLYLAVVVPPQLDREASRSGTVKIRAQRTGDSLQIAIAGSSGNAAELDALRQRLVQGYLRQLRAESTMDSATPQALLLTIPLQTQGGREARR